MTIVSNDPTWWPIINAYRIQNYCIVAAFVGITYDWMSSALTFGQEVELVWRQRWSLMTVLYLTVRYLGIIYAALAILGSVQTISLTDTVSFFLQKCLLFPSNQSWFPVGVGVVLHQLLGSLITATIYCHRCRIMYVVMSWTIVLVSPLLWVIIITRLNAMYQGSRKILIFLIVTFLAVIIFVGVVAVLTTIHTSGEELILSGTHQCSTVFGGNIQFLISMTWILFLVWEILALCLAVWIAVKRFRELRSRSAGEIVGDSYTVLIKTHVVYFASSVAVSCFQIIIELSPTLSAEYSSDTQLYMGFLRISTVVQTFVLGPRLILSIREYYANLVADSNAATGMTSIAFQQRVHISTSDGV
ncbi:uncharacterized protein EDB93DRAFT_1248262 [Suillus bovinus]|uniref:uncharacterized protein n=1 Tax=Suillus bovinus TaxID=48563 RepID=UPI001B86C03C|nr:uncharacterized protein EDB93DRAFT_1248262 [Suillus bovinus]KAG2154467.1 hypothetical protein EDB93DRAFT_1248262 [Suillus bovinus]